MRAAYAGDAIPHSGEGRFRASFPDAEARAGDPPHPAPAPATRAYGEAARPNWVAILAIVAVHAIALFALVKLDVISIRPKAAPPLVVDLVELEVTPPPPPPASPEPEVRMVRVVQPVAVAPPPIVVTPSAPPPIAVTAVAPPPQAVVVASAPKAASVGAPVSVDLSSSMVSARPPRYPAESRRKKEQGVVVLRLVLGVDGEVSQISVAGSSGFDRLDKAAMEAVRQWRWSRTMVGGQAVQVRGMVEIPFVIQT